jgi:hypothetical protein
MLGYKQYRNIRFAACLVTGGAAFFVTLQLLTPAPDAPPSKSAPIIQAVPRAEVKREDECLQRNAHLGQIPDDLRRAIIKYVLCDGAAMARPQNALPHREETGPFSRLFAPWPR